MAFVPHKEHKSKDPLIGKKYTLIKELSNLKGVFEKGTVLTCKSWSGNRTEGLKSIVLTDGEGNDILINRETLGTHTLPIGS